MARKESGSHADTTCAGNNMKLFSYTGYECNIIRFHSDLELLEDIPVVTEVTAYNYPLSGTTVMLIFNKALWFGTEWDNP